MDFVPRMLGEGLDAFVPGPSVFNGNASSFGGGFQQSQANSIMHGDMGALGSYGAGALGAAAGSALIPIPFVGGWLGSKFGQMLYQRFFGGQQAQMPQFSDYGPYSGGYQAPPDQSQPLDQGPEMPDFSHYGDELNGNMDANGNWVNHRAQNRSEALDNAYNSNALSGVSNFVANGQNVINGVRPEMGDMNGLAVYNPRLNGD